MKWKKSTANEGGNMPKKTKVLCVCSLANKLAILYGHNLEGEIYFKHSPQCKPKAQGAYE
jgi:hypothetical protein